MDHKEFDFTLPDNDILHIKFLKPEEFHTLVFKNIEYTIVGGDDVDNLIGVDADGKVWYLDTENEFAMYASKGLKTFAEQLELLINWDFPGDDDSDEVLEANAREFEREIKKLDENAMSGYEDLWVSVIEQMEDGLL